MTIKVTFAFAHPLCFDTMDQFRAWVAVARMAPPLNGMSVCADCTPEYQARMFAEHRCENGQIKFDNRGEAYNP